MSEQFIEVANKGIMYNPAMLRYGKDKIVVCDLCKESDLKTCIGYLNLDLCLKCCDEVLLKVHNDTIAKAKEEERLKQINNLGRTRMAQNQFMNDNGMQRARARAIANVAQNQHVNQEQTPTAATPAIHIPPMPIIARIVIQPSQFTENENTTFNKLYKNIRA